MPWSMAKNSLVSWPALVPQLENNVVATDSPLLRWHADTHVSMSAGFWPKDRWSTSFHLGGLVTPEDLPTGWTLWLGLAPTRDGEVVGWVCPCGGEFVSRYLKDRSA